MPADPVVALMRHSRTVAWRTVVLVPRQSRSRHLNSCLNSCLSIAARRSLQALDQHVIVVRSELAEVVGITGEYDGSPSSDRRRDDNRINGGGRVRRT